MISERKREGGERRFPLTNRFGSFALSAKVPKVDLSLVFFITVWRRGVGGRLRDAVEEGGDSGERV